ncbi:MAG: phage terminase large subunit family protein [Roseomonas sp.]|nr:phage terminase large subunit family protein [Roseomonas sp.]
MKTFRNTVLGETWQEQGEAPDWERLVERREDFRMGVVPPGARDGGAVALEDTHALRRHAKGRGEKLRIGRGMPLALALRAGARGNSTVLQHFDD